jgi:hypothetical protein
MVKQTDTNKSGLSARMKDFFFEIESPDGKKTEVSNDQAKNLKENKK